MPCIKKNEPPTQWFSGSFASHLGGEIPGYIRAQPPLMSGRYGEYSTRCGLGEAFFSTQKAGAQGAEPRNYRSRNTFTERVMWYDIIWHELKKGVLWYYNTRKKAGVTLVWFQTMILLRHFRPNKTRLLTAWTFGKNLQSFNKAECTLKTKGETLNNLRSCHLTLLWIWWVGCYLNLWNMAEPFWTSFLSLISCRLFKTNLGFHKAPHHREACVRTEPKGKKGEDFLSSHLAG